MVGHQLRVHLRQPALIAGDAIHFHHRPGRQARLGVALVPVAAVAAALRAGVVGDKVGQKTGVPRAQGVARPDLEGEHCANVVLGHVRVEVRHGVGLFPGVPRPGLVAGEPAPGHRRGDRVELHRPGCAAPVAVQRFHRFDRHTGLFRRGVRVAEPSGEIAFPTLGRRGHIALRVSEDIGDSAFALRLFGGEQVRVGGVQGGGAGDARRGAEAVAVDRGALRQRFVDLILGLARGHQLRRRAHLAEGDAQAVSRRHNAARIVRKRLLEGRRRLRFCSLAA